MNEEEKARKAFQAYMKLMLEIPSDPELAVNSASAMIKEKEEFIQSLISALSIDQKSFNPEPLVAQIKERMSQSNISDRLLYSKITERLYTCDESVKENIVFNLKRLLEVVITESRKRDKVNGQGEHEGTNKISDIEHVILKLYDHVTLAEFQVQQIRHAVDESKRDAIEAFQEGSKKQFLEFKRQAKEEKGKALLEISQKMSEKSRNSQRGYVSTLGIFSAIMLAAFSGLAVAKDAMPLINGELSKFVLVYCAVGTFIIILVQMLLNAVFTISDKFGFYKEFLLSHIGPYLICLWLVGFVAYYLLQ